MNYFKTKSAAERYAIARPDVHFDTIKRIKKYLQLTKTLDTALDIACGTGLSTKPLLTIAKNVYGTDTSNEMLKLAYHQDKINYLISPAEQQPFPDNFFDIITVSAGIHWFNISKFLTETNRLLKSNSWLILYDNYFISEMVNSKEFDDWFLNIYMKKFPSPPRQNEYDWSSKNLNNLNLNLMGEEKYQTSIPFTKRQLVLYFTSQSNIISKVDNFEITYEQAEEWLDKELDLFFSSNQITRTLNYANRIKFIQRLN